ncbi:hypothetical protein GCM10011393_19650 [Sphingopyxis bauzanensis]|nr:hypothetical protein GCM10011393_19650 [Sphingopyxis bauzanensis]
MGLDDGRKAPRRDHAPRFGHRKKRPVAKTIAEQRIGQIIRAKAETIDGKPDLSGRKWHFRPVANDRQRTGTIPSTIDNKADGSGALQCLSPARCVSTRRAHNTDCTTGSAQKGC